MRWSATFIPTLRESPADAVARSHKLMIRAGMVRKAGSGAYTYLPLGARALNKVVALVREEMDRAGAVEVLMPALWPVDLLRESGRLQVFGEDLVTFTDRHGRPHVLAPTHEEVATALVRDEVHSYRRLPLTLYQIQTKFRDEVRPRFGILRTREFLMKDAYSFSLDEAGLEECHEAMLRAYGRILTRCGLDYVVVEAESGAMGGSSSREFIVPCSLGAARYVQCGACGHAANVECAELPPPEQASPPEDGPELRRVATPGRTTIDAVSEFLGRLPAQMIKTLLYLADGEPVAALVRGDHDVNEDKLRRVLGTESLALADRATIERVTGAPVGFAGPVGLEDVPLLVDRWVATVRDGVTGANEADAHLTGVLPGRDFPLERTADIRFAEADDPCVRCGEAVSMETGVEVGHVFKLGTHYSEAMGATCTDDSGAARPFVMGCYGIGINRILAAVAETRADEDGLIWPPEIAPYAVVLLPLGLQDEAIRSAAEGAYEALTGAGIDALLDDRDESPGVRFNDADLIGFPVRIVVGRRYHETGNLEMQVRRDRSRTEVAPESVVEAVQAALERLRPGAARDAAGIRSGEE